MSGLSHLVQEWKLSGALVTPSVVEWGSQGAQQAKIVDATIASGFRSLFFPAALERAFVQANEQRRRQLIIEQGFAAMLLFGGIILADCLLTPDTIRLAAVLRFGVFAPTVLIGLWLIDRLRAPRLSEWLIALAGMFAVILTAGILLHSHSRWALSRVVELNMIVVFTCTLARFWPAVVLAVVTMLTHLLLVSALPDFSHVLVANTTVLIASILTFTLYGNYTLERDERLSYLLTLREQLLQDALQASHEQIARLATTDALTDVANRRHAQSFLERTWSHAIDKRQAVAMVMVDIDHFKAYNDRYGHQAGDRCLQSVARALSSCSRRAGDLVARLGGEEFALIMADVDAASAQAVAQRIQHFVQSLALPHLGAPQAKVVTVSVGVCAMRPRQAEEASVLMARADEALYAAKHGGRNRVCVREASGEIHCLPSPQQMSGDARS